MNVNSRKTHVNEVDAHAPNEKVGIEELVRVSAFHALYALNMK